MKIKPKIVFAVVIIMLGCSLAHVARAQTPGQPSEIANIYSCKSIAVPEDRLACYDKAVGRLEAAQARGDVVTVSKTEIENVERESFGFNIPSLPQLSKLFGVGNKPDALSSDPDTFAQKDGAVKTSTAKIDPGKIDAGKIDAGETGAKSAAKAPESKAKKAPKKTETVRQKTDFVVLNLRRTQTFGHNKTRFFFENGQVWEQVGTAKVRVPKARNGVPVTGHISRATLGSYLMRLNEKGRAIRVRRVR